MRSTALPLTAACLVLLAACEQREKPTAEAAEAAADAITAAVPAEDEGTPPFSGIGEDEVINFRGTEPFWAGEVEGKTLNYSTPENPDGETIMVERFAGRGGLGFSGQLDGAAFEMLVTPLACGDGMSEIDYPFTVTLKIAEETRNGCGWTERQPFEDPDKP
jgi:uncharacterized membrane protein